MKRHFLSAPGLLLGAAVLLAPAAARAQMTISQARAAGAGATVTVLGVVTNGPELGPIRYIQDGSAGLAAYSPSQLGSVMPGDSVLITGTLKNYNALLEMDPVASVQVLASNRTLHPVVFPSGQVTAAFAEQYESRLVRVNGNTSITTTAGATVNTFAGNTNYNLNGVSSTQVRVNSASTGAAGIVGKPAPTAGFDLIGIMSQFVTGGNSGSTTGYQLLPRLYEDFILGNAPNIASTPVVTSISTTSLTLSYTTLNAGDTHVDYGTSPANLTQMAADPAQTTQHTITMTGLQPATVYYVRVSSTNASGTSTSTVVPVITESLSSGRIRTWFNRPVDNTYAWPASNLAQYFNQTINDSVAVLMGQAQQTLDVEIYNWNDIQILNAINAAFRRGVRVRIIIDGSASGNSTAGLDAGVQIISRNTGTGIMHNKVLILDAESTNPNRPQVWCGSTNWTSGQINTDPNSALVIQDQSLARVYQMEFEEMWGSNGATAGTPKFGPQKTDNTPHYLKIGGRQVQSWFSPSDNVNSRMIEVIGTTDSDLHFATMVFTRSDIAQAIRARVSVPTIGAKSEGIINDTSGATGPFMTMKQVMGSRLRKYSGSGIFHHKYLLVDLGGQDPLTWVGSHNWSNNANVNNDENTLVIHDQAITNQYYQEFVKRWQDENTGITLVQFQVSGLPEGSAVTRLSATAYPNPSHGAFRVTAPEAGRGTVRVTLFDLNGRRVWETTTTAQADRTIAVEAASLPTGLYQLRVESAAGTQFGRVSVVQ